jgi:hypothetical protein
LKSSTSMTAFSGSTNTTSGWTCLTALSNWSQAC